MPKRKGAAQPSSTKKLKSDPTPSQASDSGQETVSQPTLSQQPPAEKSDRLTPAPVGGADLSDLGLLQRFWKAAWGEEPFKDALKDSEGKDIEYLNFREHLPAVSIFCPTVPNNGKLCVLQEYVEAFSTFESSTDETYRRGACIIGQPGIGKSCFIAYAAVERLRKKLPVAVQYTAKQYWLFSADGVSLCADRAPLRQHHGIWALSDSDVDVTIPTASFRGTFGVRTFQTTDPQTARYEDWAKQALVHYYFMDLPSWEEIKHLSLIGDRDPERMNKIAWKWGKVPRTLVDIYDDKSGHTETRYEDVVSTEVRKSVPELEKVMSGLRDSAPNVNNDSSTVYFIRPFREDDHLQRGLHELFVPTNWLQDQVIKNQLGLRLGI